MYVCMYVCVYVILCMFVYVHISMYWKGRQKPEYEKDITVILKILVVFYSN